MNRSETISEFLKLLRDAKETNSIARSVESECESQTQDILHRLEICDDSYHKQAKLARAIKTVRINRRQAKDNIMITDPIVKWCDENPQTIKSLERLLGEVRKYEGMTIKRSYIDRTEIIAEILGETPPSDSE